MSKTDVTNEGGAILFHYYGSMQELLARIYPDYPWDPSRFVQLAYWADQREERKQLEAIGQKLGVKEVPIPLSKCSLFCFVSFYLSFFLAKNRLSYQIGIHSLHQQSGKKEAMLSSNTIPL